jgi:hypothetical protein
MPGPNSDLGNSLQEIIHLIFSLKQLKKPSPDFGEVYLSASYNRPLFHLTCTVWAPLRAPFRPLNVHRLDPPVSYSLFSTCSLYK